MSSKSTKAVKVETGRVSEVSDQLTVEEPLQININGRPFTVTMRTPGDDHELVRGLLFTEGVVSDNTESVRFSDTVDHEKEVTAIVDIEIPEIYLCENLIANRSLMSTSSCGLCGKIELHELDNNDVSLDKPVTPLRMALLPKLAAVMKAEQQTFNRTGGTHAAAAFSIDGRPLCVFEDIGRHNAVDKVVGNLLDTGRLETAQVLFVSGRVSFEIVSKAHNATIPYLIAVSAPSSLAVEISQRWGMTVIGFCRGDRATVYSNVENVAFEPKADG
jgi:FdhD protein